MNVLIVGNVIKDVYLNLDDRTESFEVDQKNISWLDLSFDASEHHYYNRSSSYGGSAITLEVLGKMGIDANISDHSISYHQQNLSINNPTEVHRYILIANEKVSYFVPSQFHKTTFEPATEAYDYLFIDRSAELDPKSIHKIQTYLELSQKTKLILYVRNLNNYAFNQLIKLADLIFLENPSSIPEETYALQLGNIPSEKIIEITEKQISYQDIHQSLSPERVDLFTHLSLYSIISSTILGGFVLGRTVEESLKMAKINAENSKLNSTLTLQDIQKIIADSPETNREQELMLIAKNLVLPPKEIISLDEFNYNDILNSDNNLTPSAESNTANKSALSPEELNHRANGVILTNKTIHQTTDDGQNIIPHLISKCIIPGIKIEQNQPKDHGESSTINSNELKTKLREYFSLGCRFAKWHTSFQVQDDKSISSQSSIEQNCANLIEFINICQSTNLVPIIEPEIIFNHNLSAEQRISATQQILEILFSKLDQTDTDLSYVILELGALNDADATETSPIIAEILEQRTPKKFAGITFSGKPLSQE